MNYYLNPQKNENGGYSNFQSTSFRGAIELTEEQAKTFLAYNGFVTIQRIEDEETARSERWWSRTWKRGKRGGRRRRNSRRTGTGTACDMGFDGYGDPERSE